MNTSAESSLLKEESFFSKNKWIFGGCVVAVVVVVFVLIFAVFKVQSAKDSSSSSSNLVKFNLVKPAVVASTPAGFLVGNQNQVNRHYKLKALSTSELTSRFFSSGPVNIFTILENVDNSLKSYASRATPSIACLYQTPVPVIMNLLGVDVTFYFQCYDIQSVVPPQGSSYNTVTYFGVLGNTTYYYNSGGETTSAGISSPPSSLGNLTDSLQADYSKYRVNVWYSVGNINKCGSYAVAQVYANNGLMELTTAGKGIGYCGAQFKSYNGKINVTGSIDGPSCAATDSVCILSSNTTVTSTCDGGQSSFSLPSVGRINTTWANWESTCQSSSPPGSTSSISASQYPGGAGNFITLTGLLTDQIYFGPRLVGTTPISGIGNFNA